MPNTHILAASLLAASLCGTALAGPQHHYDRDYGKGAPHKARVLHTKPIYRTVEVIVPEHHCTPSRQAHHGSGRSRDEVVGTLVGGVVGGLLGSQVGKGGGRTAMTVAGTAIGAVIGNRLSNDDDRHGHTRQCQTIDRVDKRDELVGYRVKYRYRGSIYHTRTQRDPGQWIRVDHAARETRF
jgi:uncharacterized protein YcfJ